MEGFVALLALDALALALMFLYLKARLRRALEIDGMIEGVRKELRALINELNESADRGVSLMEDRTEAARAAAREIDRKIELLSRERGNRKKEEAVIAALASPPRPSAEKGRSADAYGRESARRVRTERAGESDGITPDLFMDPAPEGGEAARLPEASEGSERELAAPSGSEPVSSEPVSRAATSTERRVIDVARSSRVWIGNEDDPVERARDLYRRGFSSDIIAVKLGMTMQEVDTVLATAVEESGEDAGSDAPERGRK